MSAATALAQEDEAFRFVAALAKELSEGKVELPAVPDVAERVRKALDNERLTSEQLERVVGSEPILASRLVQIANSAALNFSGHRISDLRAAIARVGFAMVRTVSIAHALAQLRGAPELAELKEPLDRLWRRSVLVAALSRLVARHISPIDPDLAMFAGLLHGIGGLYILIRARHFPALFGGERGPAIIRDWHASVAKAVLENWEIDARIGAAIADLDDHDRVHEGPVDLTDVLMVACRLGTYMSHPESLELNMSDIAICKRLGLTAADYEELVSRSRDQIDELCAVLDC